MKNGNQFASQPSHKHSSAIPLMRSAIFCVGLVLAALLVGCTTSRPSAENPAALDARLELIEDRLDRVEMMVEEQAVKANGGMYVIRSGDTALSIARTFRLTPSELKALNPDIEWNRPQVGQKIKVR